MSNSCDPVDCSLPGYSVHGIFQARVLEWGAIAFSAKSLQLCPIFVTLLTIAHQAPLSRGFSRQEYLSGLPCPHPGDLPDPGIKPASYISHVLASVFLGSPYLTIPDSFVFIFITSSIFS